MRTLVVIPTYDEAASLPGLLQQLRRLVPTAQVLVVDDGSPDGTGELAEAAAVADPAIHVLHRNGKAGLGAAYRAGFAWALEAGFDRIVEMDADGSHRPEDLARLLDAADDADLVVGSRWVPGGGTVDWPWTRRLVSKGGSGYARLLLGLRQRDVTGGFRVFRADALRTIDAVHLGSQGYCFQIELLLRAHRAGLRIVEQPIVFVERREGASKMSATIMLEALWRVAGWSLRPRAMTAPGSASDRLTPASRATASRVGGAQPSTSTKTETAD